MSKIDNSKENYVEKKKGTYDGRKEKEENVGAKEIVQRTKNVIQ